MISQDPSQRGKTSGTGIENYENITLFLNQALKDD